MYTHSWGLNMGKKCIFFYTIRFLTKMVSKSLLKLGIITWKILVWDTFKKKINWVQPEYLTWVRFVTERSLIDITLSQVEKLPSGLQVYSSWLYNSLKISNYNLKKKKLRYMCLSKMSITFRKFLFILQVSDLKKHNS